ncbi:pseudouridine synthase [Mesohalobacter halotolerans]|uniref:rRNA pseudouridine synthase n=1 Tax=Mesohalobacter halotolerans TaxID=1883405 RepID=A0A4U5TSW3_9FLAO|nr:S4 domain-containing protein [Mesohalobacter halotolerans]MBS3738611.1 rRNA pseudouridine synthase [Psychroflexus sp.]TKS57266.1 rRNA pseudouridine synthase [Mesohalobacter halotolerans]
MKSNRSKGKGKKKGQRPNKVSKVDKQIKDPNAGMRLNKYIANAGICSRREADIFIEAGSVSVNGKPVTEMGYKVKLDDEVKFDGRTINPQPKEYYLLNKPQGFYTSGKIEHQNKTALNLLQKVTDAKLEPIGRLENSACGLILYTNDGTLAKKLGNAKKGIPQVYELQLNKVFSIEAMEALKAGVIIEGFKVFIDDVSYINNKSHHHIGLELKSMRPKIVPKLMTKLGYEIIKMDRTVFGNLTKLNLPRGHFRTLKKEEVIRLGML